MADRPVFHDSEPGTFATVFSEVADEGDPAVRVFNQYLFIVLAG